MDFFSLLNYTLTECFPMIPGVHSPNAVDTATRSKRRSQESMPLVDALNARSRCLLVAFETNG